MRFLGPLFPLFCVLAAPLRAETLQLQSHVTAVTLHPDSAHITREVEFDVAAGRHRLVLQDLPDRLEDGTLHITLAGAVPLVLTLRDDPLETLRRSARAQAALDRIKDLERQIHKLEAEAAQARLPGQTAEALRDFISGLGDSDAPIRAEDLDPVLNTLRQHIDHLNSAALQGETEATQTLSALTALHEDLNRARQVFSNDQLITTTLDIEAEVDGAAKLSFSYLMAGAADWTPSYEMHLQTTDTPQLTLHRKARISQYTGEPWTDVNLTLSTVAMLVQTAPSAPPSRPWGVPKTIRKSAISGYNATPMAEPVIAEEIAPQARVLAQGAGVEYSFDKPISVQPDSDSLRVNLGPVTVPVQVFAAAVPARDRVAFRMLDVTNSTDQEWLPANRNALYVDGDLVGLGAFPGLVPGAQADLAFGPLNGVQIRRDILELSAGDRGLITRTNQTREDVKISVQNLTDMAWPVHVYDAVPYSERDDMKVSWTARPTPAQEDDENRRGLLRWVLELAPGGTHDIDISVTQDWP